VCVGGCSERRVLLLHFLQLVIPVLHKHILFGIPVCCERSTLKFVYDLPHFSWQRVLLAGHYQEINRLHSLLKFFVGLSLFLVKFCTGCHALILHSCFRKRIPIIFILHYFMDTVQSNVFYSKSCNVGGRGGTEREREVCFAPPPLMTWCAFTCSFALISWHGLALYVKRVHPQKSPTPACSYLAQQTCRRSRGRSVRLAAPPLLRMSSRTASPVDS
jgi:hypothetical protein